MPRLLIKRLLWALGFVAATAFFFLLAAAVAFAETAILSAPDAAEKLNAGEIILLDIRSEEEWQETGLAEGAWPVSMHRPDFAQQLQAILAQYSPDQIGLICATGGRSSHVTGILEKNGITGVIDVSEGMFGNPRGAGWVARGLPVVTLDQAQERFATVRDGWE